MQYYSCPTRCDLGTSEWFPCGAASAVAFAARVQNKGVAVSAHDVYIDGVKIEPPLAPLGRFETEDGMLVVQRLADEDPSYRTPGPKLIFTFLEYPGGSASIEIASWLFSTAQMPTGYLHNVRLSLPGHIAPLTGVCVETLDTTRATSADVPLGTHIWPDALISSLDAECKSFQGTYTPANSAEDVCSLSGISFERAKAECPPRYLGPHPLTPCHT